MASRYERLKNITRLGKEILVGGATPKLTLNQERRMGRKIARQLEAQWRLSSSERSHRRLSQLLARLLPLTSRLKAEDYRFKVVDQGSVNALMGPGGQGFVFRGLLEKMPSDDQLAFVLAHELAHSELNHSADSLRVAMVGKKIGVLMGVENNETVELISMLANRVVEMAYDQDREFEADRLGLCLATLAGYDPRGGEGAFRRLKQLQGGAEAPVPDDVRIRIIYDVISTHPPLSERSRYQRRLRQRLRR